MAQKDYVSRGQSSSARRNTTARKKKSGASRISPFMVVIAAVVLVAFAGGLWFLTHHKKEDIEVLPGQKITNGLPPKPEERWRYIKELETRQPGVVRPTEPSAGGEVIHKEQLTNEQRQLLEQMQADMRQQPTQLNEVPWNERVSTPRQQTLPQPRQEIQRTPPQQQVQRHSPQVQHETVPPRQVQPKSPPSAPITNENTATPQSAANTALVNTATASERHFMVQCGSFKGAEPAEKVRAQLAFEGFDSHITINNDWNRVVIGPLKGKENANATLSRLKSAGHANCIRIAAGG